MTDQEIQQHAKLILHYMKDKIEESSKEAVRVYMACLVIKLNSMMETSSISYPNLIEAIQSTSNLCFPTKHD